MLYAVICRDKPDHLQTRLETRERHLEHIRASGIVVQAGPFLENEQMCGSLVILDTDSLASAQDWAAKDPYALAGLFESVTVIEWKKVIG